MTPPAPVQPAALIAAPRGIAGSATAPMMISPCATYCATGVKPRKNMTLIITLSSRLPASAPRMVPCPPRKPMPPSTAAAIEFSVKAVPMTGSPEPVCAATNRPAPVDKQAADRIGGDPRGIDRHAGAIGADRVLARRIEAEAERRCEIELPQQDDRAPGGRRPPACCRRAGRTASRERRRRAAAGSAARRRR